MHVISHFLVVDFGFVFIIFIFFGLVDWLIFVYLVIWFGCVEFEIKSIFG